MHIDDDPTSIFLSAKALISLQKVYGRIPKIYGKGVHGKKLWDLLKTMGKEELASNAMGKGAIDQLIILDRSIDVMSVLATQLTYEGLIGTYKQLYHLLKRFFSILILIKTNFISSR